MFQKKRSHDNGVTILTPGCHFHGRLFCRGSSRIGGKVEGEIMSEGLLIIEEDAYIEADIKAEHVVIQGVVKGRIEASDRLELAASSRVDGALMSPCVMIQEGAQFDGAVTMKVTAKVKVEDPKPLNLAEGFGSLSVTTP